MYEQVNLDEGFATETPPKSKIGGWTDSLDDDDILDPDQLLQKLCDSFNAAPFMEYIGLQMQVVNGQIQGFIDMRPQLIGNTHFRILHGGVTAAVLDSIGGIVAMAEIYKRKEGLIEEQRKQAARLATVDMRIDYLAPGRGDYFIATAAAVRMGRKGCTTRMELCNHEGKMIAIGTAAYAY